jgi:hypothetical protein
MLRKDAAAASAASGISRRGRSICISCFYAKFEMAVADGCSIAVTSTPLASSVRNWGRNIMLMLLSRRVHLWDVKQRLFYVHTS